VLVSALWLVAAYFLQVVGELCLSPVGNSVVTKLAPPRVVGMMMGVWFLGSSVGNFIGGRLASFYESFPLPNLFAIVAAFGIVEKHLAARPFITGDAPTIADISMVGYLYYSEETGIDRKAFPNIEAWTKRIAALPGWKHPYDLMPRAKAG